MDEMLSGQTGSPETPAGTEQDVDLTAAVEGVTPELVAVGSLGDYVRAWWARVRSGDSGILPVVGALVVLTIAFQLTSPGAVFLSPGNLVNLFIQSTVFMVLAMGEGFVLLLGEIDLSIGYVAAIGGVVTAELVQVPGPNLPWPIAILAGLAATAVIGALQGTIITRLRLPSFVVTLAGYLLWFGVMIVMLGQSGQAPITSSVLVNQQVLFGIVNSTIPPLVGWIGLVVIVVALGVVLWLRDAGRRRSGLVAPPASLTLVKIGFIAIVGIAVVAICNVNRAAVLSSVKVEGVPWVVPVVLVVLAAWMMLLEQTKFGRYVYAVGGNPEAARRAGIDVGAIRTWGFVLCGLTAGLAGIIYTSWQGGINTNLNGGQYVLYAVAAAVIGGTSLFGGRGRMIHGILGGLVIGTIYNGLFLLGFPVQWQLIATGLVLLAAVAIDTLSRRGAGGASLART